MARFERPKNAIDNYADLKVGDVIWHVCGIWPPFCSRAPSTITGEARPFRDHPEHDGQRGCQSDEIVFDEHPADWDWPHMAFASDGNLVPGRSHNDNYWFRSKEDAEAARDYLRTQWDANPDMIEAVLEDRRRWDEIDREYDRLQYDSWTDEDTLTAAR